MNDLFYFDNDGPEISGTNFWQTPFNARGFFYLTGNAGAFRLLVPTSQEANIPEMLTAREVIITRGMHHAQRREMVEVLFDDHTNNPFALHLSLGQIDRVGDSPLFPGLPPSIPHMPPCFEFFIYRYDCQIAAVFRAYWRRASLPCLKPLRVASNTNNG